MGDKQQQKSPRSAGRQRSITFSRSIIRRLEELKDNGHIVSVSSATNAGMQEWITRHFPPPNAGAGVFKQ